MLKFVLIALGLTVALVVALIVINARDPYGGVLADPDDLA
jgi:hypothetical protein